MKKLLSVFVISLMLLSSCAAAPSPLEYQKTIVKASGTLSFGDEEFEISLSPRESMIEVTSPGNIAGVTMFRRDGKLFLGAGGTEIALPDEVAALSAPVFDVFSLPEDDLAVTVSGDDRRVVTVTSPDGKYTVTLGSGGAPETIEFSSSSAARDFTLKNITIAP